MVHEFISANVQLCEAIDEDRQRREGDVIHHEEIAVKHALGGHRQGGGNGVTENEEMAVKYCLGVKRSWANAIISIMRNNSQRDFVVVVVEPMLNSMMK